MKTLENVKYYAYSILDALKAGAVVLDGTSVVDFEADDVPPFVSYATKLLATSLHWVDKGLPTQQELDCLIADPSELIDSAMLVVYAIQVARHQYDGEQFVTGRMEPCDIVLSCSDSEEFLVLEATARIRQLRLHHAGWSVVHGVASQPWAPFETSKTLRLRLGAERNAIDVFA